MLRGHSLKVGFLMCCRYKKKKAPDLQIRTRTITFEQPYFYGRKNTSIPSPHHRAGYPAIPLNILDETTNLNEQQTYPDRPRG